MPRHKSSETNMDDEAAKRALVKQLAEKIYEGVEDSASLDGSPSPSPRCVKTYTQYPL